MLGTSLKMENAVQMFELNKWVTLEADVDFCLR